MTTADDDYGEYDRLKVQYDAILAKSNGAIAERKRLLRIAEVHGVAVMAASIGYVQGTCKADAHLIAAAPLLLEAVTSGAQVNLPDLLDWLADRLVHKYGESPYVDFVQTCRHRAAKLRAAIAAAEGRQ